MIISLMKTDNAWAPCRAARILPCGFCFMSGLGGSGANNNRSLPSLRRPAGRHFVLFDGLANDLNSLSFTLTSCSVGWCR
jgi:hypothetical protein